MDSKIGGLSKIDISLSQCKDETASVFQLFSCEQWQRNQRSLTRELIRFSFNNTHLGFLSRAGFGFLKVAESGAQMAQENRERFAYNKVNFHQNACPFRSTCQEKSCQLCFLFSWSSFSSFLEEDVLGKYNSEAIPALTTILLLKSNG